MKNQKIQKMLVVLISVFVALTTLLGRGTIVIAVDTTPYSLKSDTIIKLENAKTGDKRTDNKIENIIKHINDSLDDSLWLNEYELVVFPSDDPAGLKVFHAQHASAELLQNEVRNRKVAEELRDIYREVLNDLEKADGIIISTVLNKVLNTPIEDGEIKDRFNHEVDKAFRYLDQIGDNLKEDNISKAIKNYEKGWQHLQYALDFVKTVSLIGVDGGTVYTSDGKIDISIPEGALEEDTLISITPILPEIVENKPTDPNSFLMLEGVTYNFEPGGLAFSVPITLEIHYRDEDIGWVNEDTLQVYTYKQGGWVLVGGVLNKEDNIITAQIDHFSSVGVGGWTEPTGPGHSPRRDWKVRFLSSSTKKIAPDFIPALGAYIQWEGIKTYQYAWLYQPLDHNLSDVGFWRTTDEDIVLIQEKSVAAEISLLFSLEGSLTEYTYSTLIPVTQEWEESQQRYLNVKVVPAYIDITSSPQTFDITVEQWNFGTCSGTCLPAGSVPKQAGTESYIWNAGLTPPRYVQEIISTNQIAPLPSLDTTATGVITLSPLYSLGTAGLYKSGWNGTVTLTNGVGSVSGVRYKLANGNETTSERILLLITGVASSSATGNTLLQVNPILVNVEPWVDTIGRTSPLWRVGSTLYQYFNTPSAAWNKAVESWNNNRWSYDSQPIIGFYMNIRTWDPGRAYDAYIFGYKAKLTVDLTGYNPNDYVSAHLVVSPKGSTTYYNEQNWIENQYNFLKDMMDELGNIWISDEYYASSHTPSMPLLDKAKGYTAYSYYGHFGFKVVLIPVP